MVCEAAKMLSKEDLKLLIEAKEAREAQKPCYALCRLCSGGSSGACARPGWVDSRIAEGKLQMITCNFDYLCCCRCRKAKTCVVKTRERRGSSFSQLGLEPNHTGLTAQSLFFLEESCRVKRSDTQTSSNFSNYFKRVLKLQKRSSSFSK